MTFEVQICLQLSFFIPMLLVRKNIKKGYQESLPLNRSKEVTTKSWLFCLLLNTRALVWCSTKNLVIQIW